ncbi:biliverdin-producing heme oxygenase [Sphingomonas colocasiae]|uniref:Biliverdin-producing heme oxygenase n=1 Tax=Sphingomonas colocasiae TaxID=1848973 RepID=A0ABS7PNU4_9SPHN|nr:biliverdin-producing heme oxygenase [Sphingomonas colocasiae]MBY8822390.1 biliverdin-producing heme oxygenase [Sphingomonas colocasiae]
MPFHRRLREATRDEHDAVDRAFGSLGLESRTHYARFLRAHARILPAVERAADPATLLPGWRGRTADLAADLAALDIATPESLPFSGLPGAAARWGAIYVIEGSRLGGAMLARGVPVDLPKAYLSAVHGPGGWRRIQAMIDAAADGAGALWHADAIDAARATFSAYRLAATIEDSAHG